MPLSLWFWGAYLVTTQTPGQSALQFQRQLGISRYETAFQTLHKLRAVMVRPDRDTIGGQYPVEIDETLVGGRTRGEGRGVRHKATVVGAIEVRHCREGKGRAAEGQRNRKGKPLKRKRTVYAGRLRLSVVPGRGAEDLTAFVKETVTKGAVVRTDGRQGYDSLTKLGYDHDAVVLDGEPEKTDAHLPMIHIVFSNLKTWLLNLPRCQPTAPPSLSERIRVPLQSALLPYDRLQFSAWLGRAYRATDLRGIVFREVGSPGSVKVWQATG
jgi:hypothetical protein